MDDKPEMIFPPLRSAMCQLIPSLLLRLASLALTFALALCVTFVYRLIPVFQSPPDSSQRLVGVMTPAVVERMWPVGLIESDGLFWVFRREASKAEFDVNQPIALRVTGANLINAGCQTLVVSADAARKLKLNTDDVGSLNDPSELKIRLREIFRERELYRAYKPGMEYRSELPTHERIEKSVIIIASPFLRYEDALALLRGVESTGAAPIVLQVGEGTHIF